jgi:hypothetical protein
VRFWSPEILVGLAVTLVILGVSAPALQVAREKAREQGRIDRLKQVGMSLHAYHDVHQTFPAGPVAKTTKPKSASRPKAKPAATEPETLISPL